MSNEERKNDFERFKFGYVIYSDFKKEKVVPVVYVEDTEDSKFVSTMDDEGCEDSFQLNEIFDHYPTDEEINKYLIGCREADIEDVKFRMDGVKDNILESEKDTANLRGKLVAMHEILNELKEDRDRRRARDGK